MLKIYDMKSFFRLDQQDWQEAKSPGWFCKDESEVQPERIIVNDASWDKVYDALKESPCDPLFADRTFFRKRPYIYITMSWPSDSINVFPTDCKTLSYKVENIERKYVSLEWIMKNLSADKAIQYLKERGITACPMLKDNSANDLLWGRDWIDTDDNPREKQVIFGHTPRNTFKPYQTTSGDICIDCGCVFGGSLCSIVLRDDGSSDFVAVKKSNHDFQ